MKKVLVIDDEDICCKSLQRVLQDVCHVDICTTSREVCDYFSTHPDPDLILIDYQICDENGIEIFRNEIVDKGKRVPAILISGYVGGAKHLKLQKEAEKYFVTIIEKPFDALVLRGFVAGLLESNPTEINKNVN